MRFLLRPALQYSQKEAKPPRIAEASPCQLRMIVEVSPIRGAGSNASPSLWRRGAIQKNYLFDFSTFDNFV